MTAPKRTQRDRVLDLLREAGPRGITQFDFDGPTLDGGKPIRRLASRIDELRKAGHAIDSTRRHHHVAVYVLIEAPAVESPGPAVPGAADARLFDVVAVRSALDPWDGVS